MQITGLSIPVAPQTTGHPLGLPEPPEKPAKETRIEPIVGARDPKAKLGDGHPPIEFLYAVTGRPNPETHVAPPSIMQIKISQILDAQADAWRTESKEDKDGADVSVEEPKPVNPDAEADPAARGATQIDEPETQDPVPAPAVIKAAPPHTAVPSSPVAGYEKAANVTQAPNPVDAA